jgi:two-component system response regulator RstA
MTAPSATVMHCVAVWSDDSGALPRWHAALADEGLATMALDDRLATGDRAGGGPVPDAILLCITRSLSEHLARLRELRARLPTIALVVACRGERELDHILALEMGADDVIDVEWSAPVLAARLRVQWRRSAPSMAAAPQVDELRFGALLIQLRGRNVTLKNQPVALTAGEFELLWLLAGHAGRALARRDILRQLRSLDDSRLDRSIDSRIYRIRAKLGNAGAQRRLIRTVRNCGYLFSAAGW